MTKMAIKKPRNQLELHLAFYAGILMSALSLVSMAYVPMQMTIAIAAILFFGTYLGVSGLHFGKMDAAFMKQNAADGDMPVGFIFLATGMAIVISIGSLFFLINNGNTTTLPAFFLSLASVALGWTTVHTMAALHYAHLFWQPDDTAPANARHRVRRGLTFPETPEPSIADFLYFSFVIGMTAQTSDVVISTTAMRRVNLAHAVVSFFFNTVLVAAAVNIAVSFHAASHG